MFDYVGQQRPRQVLDSRKTQRQDVSYYFNNNDKKLIPMRRTNYLIGAQSMTHSQVVPSSAPAPYYGGLMNSNPTQYTRMSGYTT